MYVDSINRAKRLYENFDDIVHDIHHSERVAKYAHKVAESIDFEDDGILELCAFWHDTARTKGIEPHEEAGAQMARDDLLAHRASEDEASKIYEGIRFHKSTASPVTIEGKIIRDADKLDIFTLERWQAVNRIGWEKRYADDLKKTVETMDKYPDAFTYDYTKKKFEEMKPKFLTFWEDIKSNL